MTDPKLGEILKAAREQQGLSLYALAQACGVDRSLLWKLERGDVADPRPETLSKIAEALGLSMTNMYTNAGYVSAERLPDIGPYLRAKYGHLPPEKRAEVAAYFASIEAEYGPKPKARARATKKSTDPKGGHDANDN